MFASSHHLEGDPKTQAIGDWFLSSGLEVGPLCWMAKLETDDGSCLVQMGRKREGGVGAVSTSSSLVSLSCLLGPVSNIWM